MFNMNAIESGAYPLQMFFFIKTHFDIFFRIAKKKKPQNGNIIGNYLSGGNCIHMESGFNQNQILVCWYTERESIKLQSDCLIINLVMS